MNTAVNIYFTLFYLQHLLGPFQGGHSGPLSRVVVVDIDAPAACDSSGDTW